MAATLNTPDTLPQFTEVLGTQLGAYACLLLRYHHDTEDMAYTFWRTGEPPGIWTLPNNNASPKLVLQRRIVHSLTAQVPFPEDRRGHFPWRNGLIELLSDTDQSLEWLQNMQAVKAISVDSAPDIDGMVLLLSPQADYSTSLNEAQEVDVASIVAIALHQHHLQHQAQRSTEQLRYLNYLKEDFLSTLNHELRTPLTSMMLAIRMLRRSDLSPERAAMYLDILEQQCSREINLVNDLLMLQTVDAKTTRAATTPTDLVELLTQVAEKEHSRFAAAHLDLVLDVPLHSLVVATSTDYLTRVMQELLTNAQKYSVPGSVVTLKLEVPPTQHRLAKIQLINTGEGIRAEELPHIFDKFRRGQNATKKAIPGTGTGLALVKGLIEQIGGQITVSSQPTDDEHWQTCFTIELLP